MGSFSIWHWMIVLVIVLVLFGRGRVSEIMGDFGKGIKSFKQGMNEEEARKADADKPVVPPAQISATKVDPVAAPSATETKNEQV
ncbi:twin-arginine translocase TatA/TatE family subunit [Novosphingobium sp. FGD1]|jgi:sec-independent protein translocase protein TatA|uniref:Sec-independent protein translocase protein TatA n=1 Tax=Novosphingobium silvae TaxID=2692619 RepID=A0A7X4K6J9_9SPHN|nr:twin-arginine translocase TatA/TatE family subunit [Novosphingobium silvae]MYL96323.1 twin-arginine translocase TatA/TatE family subunit [Novosphingobium silvae]